MREYNLYVRDLYCFSVIVLMEDNLYRELDFRDEERVYALRGRQFDLGEFILYKECLYFEREFNLRRERVKCIQSISF